MTSDEHGDPINLKDRIDELEENVRSLEKQLNILAPFIKEIKSKDLAKDRLVVSCSTANNSKNQYTIGFVIRHPSLPNKVEWALHSNTQNYIEANLDAIYTAIRSYYGLNLFKRATLSQVEIHSTSIDTVNFLKGKSIPKSSVLQHKIDCIKDEVKALSLLLGCNVFFIHKEHQETGDLTAAYQLAKNTLWHSQSMGL